MTRSPHLPNLCGALALLVVAGCGKSPPPAAAPAPPTATAAPAASPRLVLPDACALLDVNEVARVAGWGSAKAVPVKLDAEYLAQCDFVDAADAGHRVQVNIAYGALIPDDSQNYAQIVGTREDTLAQPAKPVTTFGVPTIEMDAGPGRQMMQTRYEPTTELTVTAPTMANARALFPRALIKLQALQKAQAKPAG